MRLLLNIDHQHISIMHGQSIVSDSVRYLTAQFGFSEDWDGTEKTAIFSGKGGTYEVLLTNDSCTVPHEVISGRFGVSVFGIRDGVRITTDTVYLCVQQSGYLPGETPAEPTPSVYEQIIGKIAEEETDRKAADKALTDTVNSALEAEAAARLELDERLTMIQDGTELHSFSGVETALNDKQDKLTFDDMPIGDSKNPVISGGVKTALDKKQDKLIFDNTPTGDSKNPVTSGGVKTVLDKKADKDEIPEKVSDLTDDLSLAKTTENNNFTAAQTINGTLTVNGDIVQNGASYESHAEQLFTKNDLIKTREGAVGGLGEDEYTGIEAEKYDGTNNGRLVFDKKGVARVGDVGSEQPLLTREEATDLKDNQLFAWDADTQRATGLTISSGFGIATNQKTGEENLVIWGATETQINQRAGNYLPITVGNLDYAVRSVLPQTSDTIPATLAANTEYYAGELTAVSFALPTTGKLGQYCFVKFDSGATATTLTVTGSYAGEIPTPIANKTYEIFATWNGSKWVCSYRGY